VKYDPSSENIPTNLSMVFMVFLYNGKKGHVYYVEFAAKALRELVNNVYPYKLSMTSCRGFQLQKYAVFIRGKMNIYRGLT
jgi:hypothetical protein